MNHQNCYTCFQGTFWCKVEASSMRCCTTKAAFRTSLGRCMKLRRRRRGMRWVSNAIFDQCRSRFSYGFLSYRPSSFHSFTNIQSSKNFVYVIFGNFHSLLELLLNKKKVEVLVLNYLLIGLVPSKSVEMLLKRHLYCPIIAVHIVVYSSLAYLLKKVSAWLKQQQIIIISLIRVSKTFAD